MNARTEENTDNLIVQLTQGEDDSDPERWSYHKIPHPQPQLRGLYAIEVRDEDGNVAGYY
jgi:hypothetical protein